MAEDALGSGALVAAAVADAAGTSMPSAATAIVKANMPVLAERIIDLLSHE
jgi:hypothetical protein